MNWALKRSSKLKSAFASVATFSLALGGCSTGMKNLDQRAPASQALELRPPYTINVSTGDSPEGCFYDFDERIRYLTIEEAIERVQYVVQHGRRTFPLMRNLNGQKYEYCRDTYGTQKELSVSYIYITGVDQFQSPSTCTAGNADPAFADTLFNSPNSTYQENCIAQSRLRIPARYPYLTAPEE